MLVKTDALTGQQHLSCLVAHGVRLCLVLEEPDIHQKTLLQTTQLIFFYFTVLLWFKACLDAWCNPTQPSRVSRLVD